LGRGRERRERGGEREKSGEGGAEKRVKRRERG